MRCAQCGLPLSPTRNSCPRCGTPINVPNAGRVESSPLTPNTFGTQMPFPAQQHSLFEDEQLMFPSEPTQQANLQSSFPLSSPSSPLDSYPTHNLPNRSRQPNPHKPSSSAQSHSKITTIGLTSAGLCIVAGSLLLVFVYLVGQGFLPPGAAPTSNIPQANIVKANQTATATYLSKPSSPAITPTPTLPGQGLLDISVLSNDLNGLQPATDFKVNQTIYVVLSLHPGGNSHAICLDWYLNDQSVKKFGFEVDPTSTDHYYSYTIMVTTGNGHVDISLASTKACIDTILAKKLNFTVST